MTATRRALTSGLWLATALALNTTAHAAVGRTAGAPAVSPGGEAQYTVPIFAPPGTAGMTPQLALSYGSRGGDALLGAGWSVRAGRSRGSVRSTVATRPGRRTVRRPTCSTTTPIAFAATACS